MAAIAPLPAGCRRSKRPESCTTGLYLCPNSVSVDRRGLCCSGGAAAAGACFLGGRVMLIDTHVHLHECFDRAVFLDAAVINLSKAARVHDHSEEPGALVLTEISESGVFEAFAAGQGLPKSWRAELTQGDPEAVWLQRTDGTRLLIVSGRQIVSAEGLEVLALASRPASLSGQTAKEILASLGQARIPAVLPWGAGKWLGRRGRVLQRLLEAGPRGGLFLGDNAGRPAGWPAPSCFGGMPVLPGTDPLPLAASVRDAGRYGIVLDPAPDPACPAADLRDRLMRMTKQPPTFGRRCGPVTFLRRQARLRAG